MNGQQFSLQPVSFYYYTVTKVVPFGVPVNYPSMGGTEVDKKVWLACPDVSEYCRSTVVKDYGKPLATIRIYGNNFRKDAQPVRGAIYDKPHCRYGRFEDDIPVRLCAYVVCIPSRVQHIRVPTCRTFCIYSRLLQSLSNTHPADASSCAHPGRKELGCSGGAAMVLDCVSN
jgi:hypothetical protein